MTNEHEAVELSIGEAAARTGLSVHALRFYEREKLLLSLVRRTSGGRRVYCQQDLEWLAICTRLRASGMSLADLRAFAELVRSGPGNEEERLVLLSAHRSRVQARLDELQACLDLISWKVGVYEQRVTDGTARGVWDPAADDHATWPSHAQLGDTEFAP